jgi:hypothetical protein
MLRLRTALVLSVATGCVAIAAACAPDGAACAPGDYRYCPCPSTPHGYMQCAEDGKSYGACDCSGAVPPGAGILVEAGAPDSGDAEARTGAFLSPCSDNAECTTGLCFGFNAYGPHCSQSCQKDLDCPPPSPGCSNNKICKLH